MPSSLENQFTQWQNTQINRITIPCGSNSLLMVSTEKDLEPQKIIDDVLDLIEKFSDDPNYTPRSPHLNF